MVSSLPKELREKLDVGINGVLVVGVFDGRYVGNALPMLGALKDVHNVERLTTVPSEP
jgi:hypothetical protein